MVALFLAMDLVFRMNVSIVQDFLGIVKTIVIAIFIKRMGRGSWWVSVMACFLSCLLFVPVPDTLIYGVPSMVEGCVIGLQKDDRNQFKNYMLLFAVNSLIIVYKFFMLGFFMQIDTYALYRGYIVSALPEITGGMIAEAALRILFILFMTFDSAFSSLIIFGLFRAILKKLKEAKNVGTIDSIL